MTRGSSRSLVPLLGCLQVVDISHSFARRLNPAKVAELQDRLSAGDSSVHPHVPVHVPHSGAVEGIGLHSQVDLTSELEELEEEVDASSAADVATAKLGLAKVSTALASTIMPWTAPVTSQDVDYRATFGNSFWEVVEHALKAAPQSERNSLKVTWDKKFQNVTGLDSFVAKWGGQGDLDALQFALNKLIADAESVVGGTHPEAKPYFGAWTNLVEGLKGSVTAIQEGALADGVDKLWKSHVAAAGQLLATGLQTRGNLEAISEAILAAGKPQGQNGFNPIGLIYRTASYRQDRFLSLVCYKRMPLKENVKAESCMKGWKSDGQGMCWPGKFSGAPCHSKCDRKSGFCPKYCGETKACCRKGWDKDNLECRGATNFVDHPGNKETPRDYWQCVDPGPGLGPSEDCWEHCHGRAGPCNACSLNGFCMKDGKHYHSGNRSKAPKWILGIRTQPHPDALVIQGAGDSKVNGVWIQSGWRKGHPYYRKKGQRRYQMYWSNKRQAWRLFNDGWWRNRDLYWSTVKTPTAPTTGWVAKKHGRGPVPTLKIVNDGIYEQTKNSRKKPAQGGNYRCMRIINGKSGQAQVVPPAAALEPKPQAAALGEKEEEQEAPLLAAPDEEAETEEQEEDTTFEGTELEVPAVDGAGASLAQLGASSSSTVKKAWWCFWCREEPKLGGLPARCNMSTPHKFPSNGFCYKYNCELGFDPVKDTDIDCQQRCWGDRNVPVGPVCGRSPEETYKIAFTLSKTAGQSTLGLISVGLELKSKGLSADMAVFKSCLGAWTPLLTSFAANRNCPIDPDAEV